MSNQREIYLLLQQAEALIAVNRLTEAGQVLAHGLSQDPANYDLLCQMAWVLSEQDRWRQALDHAERAIAIEPEADRAHRIRSGTLRKGSRRRESLIAAKEAIRLSPGERINWQNLVAAELALSHVRKARSAAEHLRELAPDWYVSHQSLALVALKQKMYAEAEAHCRRELALNATSYHGMNNLGVALLNQKRKRDAVTAFHRAAKLDPADPLARKNLNIAAGKYLPRIGIVLFGLWIGIRALVSSASVIEWTYAIVIIPVVVGISVGSYLLLRRERLRQLPDDVQQYFKFRTVNKRREQLRDVLLLIWVGTLLLFGFWCFILYAFWYGGTSLWPIAGIVLPPVTLLGIALAALLGYLRMRSDGFE